MFRLFTRALMHRPDKQLLTQFKPPVLPNVSMGQVLTIDKQHYQQYAAITEWQNADNLHPCYLQVLSLPMQLDCLSHPRSPFPLLGLVHRENTIYQTAPIDRDRPLTLHVAFADVIAHRRGWDVKMVTHAEQDDQTCYRAVATYLVRVNAPHVERGGRVAPQKSPRNKSVEGGEGELAPWQEIGRIHAAENIGRRYARISQDGNPIHLSAMTAKLFGFPKAIAHGMWTLACSVSHCCNDVSASEFDITCQFKKPLLLPGEAILRAQKNPHDIHFKLASASHAGQIIDGTVLTAKI